MLITFKKKFLSSIMILAVFAAGFVAGCGGGNVVTSAAQDAVKQIAAAMPESIKGVHSVPAVGTIDVAFSPKGGIAGMIVNELSKAKKTIQVQAYSFTNTEIAKALADAKKRGVDVRVVLDKSQETEQYSSATFLANAGIPVHIDREFQIAHNKIMIIDGIDIITGSFNFTKSAENSNAENCLVIHGNKQLADLYSKNWEWRWNATGEYTKK